MAEVTKVVKVPVALADDDAALRLLKYRALDDLMSEARYLGNMAIRYSLAFRLHGIAKVDPRTGKDAAPDTIIYGILAKERKFLSAAVIATLARNFAGKMVRTVDRDAWAGRKSLPTFRALFIPFRHQDTKIEETPVKGVRQFAIAPAGFADFPHADLIAKHTKGVKEKHAEFDPASIAPEQRRLRLLSRFSWKDDGAAEVVARIQRGEYKLCDSQLRKDDGELMLFLTYKFTPPPVKLDPAKVCGVDLGVVIPAVCALNDGPQRANLGNGADVWAARSKFRAERRRAQRRLGLYTRSQQWQRSEKEDRWIQTYYHALTRGVIKFCLQHGCGTIHMEDLEALRAGQQEDEYQRLMWMPSKFHTLLAYKAKELGIEIIKINPRNSSRRCSACGHTQKENRPEQNKFICLKCGDPQKPVNADWNAAKNLALASGDVIKHGYPASAPEANSL